MISIIDYKAGNSTSVYNALNEIGIHSHLIQCSEDLKQSRGIILPGVGSAKETIKSLLEMNLLGELKKRVLVDKIPFLGICVGLQVLFEYSEEDNTKCLNWIRGRVKNFHRKMYAFHKSVGIRWNSYKKTQF